MAPNDMLRPQMVNGACVAACFCVVCREEKRQSICDNRSIEEVHQKIFVEIKERDNDIYDQMLANTLKTLEKIIYIDSFRVMGLSPLYNPTGLK